LLGIPLCHGIFTSLCFTPLHGTYFPFIVFVDTIDESTHFLSAKNVTCAHFPFIIFILTVDEFAQWATKQVTSLYSSEVNDNRLGDLLIEVEILVPTLCLTMELHET